MRAQRDGNPSIGPLKGAQADRYGNPSIDPLKEAQADRVRLSCQTMSLDGAMRRAGRSMRNLAWAFGGPPDHVAEFLADDRWLMACGAWSVADCVIVGWDVWWLLKLLEVI